MAKRVIVDASIALSWVLPGESTHSRVALRDRAAAEPSLSLLVPPTFWYEVSNSLWVNILRGRIKHDDAMAFLELLDEFRFETWMPNPVDCLSLALFHNIAAYDSAYLAIAVETESPLWTVDAQLAAATRAAGITVEPV